MTRIEISQLQILDAMGHAVILTDADGVIVRWNAGAEQLYGWTASEAIGRRTVDLMTMPDADENTEITAAVFAGKTWSGDYLVRCKGGSGSVLVHATSAALTGEAGDVEGIVNVSHDVSERRSSEAALRRDKEQLQLAFASGRMGAWSWDVRTGVVAWDAAMEARYGIPEGTFTGTSEEFMSRVHEDDRARLAVQIENARTAGLDINFEHRVVWPDGSVHWLEARGQCVFDDSGTLIAMVGVGIDIDERKQLEALLLETSELRAAARFAADLEQAERIARMGSWRWEAATNIVITSAEMARMLDIPRTLTGIEFADALRAAAHPSDVAAIEGATTEALRSGRDRFVMECRLVIGGNVRLMVHRGEIRHADDNALIEVRGTFHDITEQRRAEEALLAARERLGREQRAVQVLHETLIRPAFPHLDQFDIAARYVAAENDSEVGGDWYDAFALPDGRIMLAVGDVSGHGVSSARLMAKLRHATRAYACIGDDLSELIARLDAFLIQFRDDIQIATLLLGRLDPDRAALELVSAGHPPPLLARGHDSEYLAVPPGPPLGSWHGQEAFRFWRTRLAPDDALLMY